MSSLETAEGNGRSTTHQPPAPVEYSSHTSNSGGDLTEETPIAVEPPVMTVSAPIIASTSIMSVEGMQMDIDLPLNDLSDDSGSHVSHFNEDGADEAAGFAASSSVGSLSLDDHLAIASAAATATAAGDEASTTSAGTAGSAVRGRRPSFQAQRRPSQRRRSSATSFEMHDSLIFEELNKLVEDDTDDSEDENENEDGKIPASISPAAATGDACDVTDDATNQDAPPIDIIDSHNSSGGSLNKNNNNNNNNNNNRRAGRRGSSRSLASVLEDMELDDDLYDDDTKNGKTNKKDTASSSSIPVVLQIEQRILDRLERQDDKRSLVRTRSEASLLNNSVRGGQSALRLGDMPGPQATSNSNNASNRREDRLLHGSRAVQSERVLTGRAREVWPEINVDVDVGGAAGATGAPISSRDDVAENNKEKAEGRNKANRSSFIKSLFRGLGRKK